jgi:hypothetical protein
MRTLVLTLAVLTGCATRPPIVATPETKAEAVSLYIKGATSAELSEHFNIDREDARELIRITIRDLYKKYSKDR